MGQSRLPAVSRTLVFSVLHAGIISPSWFDPGTLHEIARWLSLEAPNPFSCAAIGEIVSALATWLASLRTKQLPAPLLEQLFPKANQQQHGSPDA